MKKNFIQRAYYIGNENVFFVDRIKAFSDEIEAYRDLDRFACKNRTQNMSYKCVVFEDVRVHAPQKKDINYELAKRIAGL